jgi:phage shock protein PspC (stress-responsive transcriptional regulator)
LLKLVGRQRMKLHRSTNDSMIAGVCGGLAEFLGWSPTRMRIVYVIVSILSAAFPGILIYLALWFLMPKGLGNMERPGRNRSWRSAR